MVSFCINFNLYITNYNTFTQYTFNLIYFYCFYITNCKKGEKSRKK